MMVANLGGGGDELGDLVQAVQVRNQLQPQVDLRTAEQRSHKVTALHNQTSLRKEVSQQLSVGGFLFVFCIGRALIMDQQHLPSSRRDVQVFDLLLPETVLKVPL